jgi:hemoglobin/transferrin/lactoferrin receptor protein
MIKFFSSLCLCALFCLFVNTQTYAQSILTVVDQTTQQPLSDANIEEHWTNPISGKLNIIKGLTNTKGEYELHTELTQYNGKIFIQQQHYQQREITSFELLQKGYKVNLTPTQVQMTEVLVSATKFNEQQQYIPRQVAIIRSRDISFSNQQNTADLLQNSGEVFVQKSQMGGGSIVMRGFEANKILMVIDGVRMNNAIYRGGHLQNVLRIDQNTIQHSSTNGCLIKNTIQHFINRWSFDQKHI